MLIAAIEKTLQFLSLVGCLLAVARLIQLQLVRVYPFFFVFLCVPLILQTMAVVWGSTSRVFFYSFVALEPIRIITFILVVWELFSAVFKNYAGLRSLSRWVMGLAAGVAQIGLIFSLMLPRSHFFSRATLRVIRFERGVAFSLVIFIVILLYFISKYPIKLPRNTVVLCMLYGAWFLGDSVVLLISGVLPSIRITNDALAILEIGSYTGWIVLLSKAGESQQTRVRQHIPADRENELIGQLRTINEIFLRAGRSISPSRAGGD